MHKKLNIFEYQITNDKTIELTTVQTSNLLNEIIKDIDYLKYELVSQNLINYLMRLINDDEELKDKLIEYIINDEELKIELLDNIDTNNLIDKSKSNLKKNTVNRKHKGKNKKRNYNTNNKIKKLFIKYYDETKTKKDILQKIADKLNITYKAVEKAYYKK